MNNLMNNLTLHKASKIRESDPEQPTIVIYICLPLPEDAAEAMEQDAEKLVNALRDTLPMSTWTHLIAKIASRWAAEQHGIITPKRWYGEGETP